MIAGPRIVAALAILLLLLASGGAVAQQTPSLAVRPVTQTVAPEADSFDVQITVDDITNDRGLGGYMLIMSYDPAVVHALATIDSGFVTSTGNGVVCPASTIDNDTGLLGHLCFAIPIFLEPGPQAGEPEVLLTIRFEPIAEGVTTLDISDATISDPQGSGLGASTSNGQVIVERGAAGPTPTGAVPGPSPGASPVDGAADATGLPTSGTGTGRPSDNLVHYVSLALATLGAAALLIPALQRARRRE